MEDLPDMLISQTCKHEHLVNDDAELFSNKVFRQKLKNKFEFDVEKKLVENREMPVKKGSRKTDIGRSKKSKADVAIAIVLEVSASNTK